MKYFFLFIALSLSMKMFSQKTSSKLFTRMSPSATGVAFVNQVKESDSLHIMKYEYLYNGHGVGIGDFNNDGLPDMFISGNTTPGKLFLNRGDFRFTDATKHAGIVHRGTWSTGVSVADVNGDGLTDIYICHSGSYTNALDLRNELYINQGISNGVPTFKEMASEYGLDASGTQSTQALFLDYDLDGDLDMFLLNHSNHTYNPFLNTRKIRTEPNMSFGNRLFRNDKKGNTIVFTDVTLESGIINNSLNFGLSVNASDINNDGWPDIYTTSDYTEKDCLYLNTKNGTFTESIEKSVAHMSKYSMGADISDYNNDGHFDILTLDMLPADHYRQKLLKGPDEYDQYHLLADSGYYHQQMRNMLQLNRGNNKDGVPRFSEIGQFAGVSNTDWSWSGLFADFDKDGWKDLFISNGYLRDFTNLDFLRFTVSDAQLEEAKKGNFNFKTFDLVRKMPLNKLSSYALSNNGDLTFSDKTKSWGLDDQSVSNGAAYADFDNDGDLDLVVCRNNDPVAVYRNNSELLQRNKYVKVRLSGSNANTAAFGAKIRLYTGSLMQVQEQYPVRGYQSTVSTDLFFGVGEIATIDSLVVEWPSLKSSVAYNLKTDSTYLFTESEARVSRDVDITAGKKYFDTKSEHGLTFRHKENSFVDFKDEPLLPYQLSRSGPALAKADVNGDGLEDVFFGGAIEQSGALFIQEKGGTFSQSTSQPWINESAWEDVNALFFDADSDGDQDLYVVSGGNEYGDGSPEYSDRLYINDGKGNFKISAGLPQMLSSKQAVSAADFDGDGDLDLFIGGKSVPGSYPLPARSYLLRNDSKPGQVLFSDVTPGACSELMNIGLVNDAVFTDLDADGLPELLLCGEWMPLQIFKNNGGKFTKSEIAALSSTSGLWSKVVVADVDNDGDSDFIIGNAGTNLQFRASVKEPVEIYADDFDQNGTVDAITCYYIQGKSYPMASRDELLDQLPGLKKKYLYFRDYANADLYGIISKAQADKAYKAKLEVLESVILINNGNMKFTVQSLPSEAQFSTINGIIAEDFTGDGKTDLVIAGNFYPYRVQLGRSDASLGLLLEGNGKGNFQSIPFSQSGLEATGDVRRMLLVKQADGKRVIVVAKNDEQSQVIECR